MIMEGLGEDPRKRKPDGRKAAVPPSPVPTEMERAWFETMLAKGDKERVRTTANISPGLAALMLELNIGNRHITESKVLQHIERLQAGTFILHHQGIAFANIRVINDGQHRLTAIVRSGISAASDITFGADREEMAVVDQGKARTAGDILSIRQQKSWNLRASVARHLLFIKRGGHPVPDTQAIADYAIETASDEMDEALKAGGSIAAAKICAPTPFALAYYHIRTNTARLSRFKEFMNGFSKGENLDGTRAKLRDWLQNKPNSKGFKEARTNVTTAGVIVLAWNDFAAKKKGRALSNSWPHTIKLPDVV